MIAPPKAARAAFKVRVYAFTPNLSSPSLSKSVCFFFFCVNTPTMANPGLIWLKLSQNTYFGQRNRGKIGAKLSDQLENCFKVHEVPERAFFDNFRLRRPVRPLKLGGMRQMRPYLESSHRDESTGISLSSIRQSIDAKTLV